MKLTPLDIHHKEFHHALRGYSEEEVDTFLDEVAEEFERLFKENIDLSEKLEAASAKVRDYQSMEVTLNNTMVSAQRSAEHIVAQANDEASAMLRDAESKAKEIIHAAIVDKQRARTDLESIVRSETDFRTRFRALLEKHLGEIRQVELSPEVANLVGEVGSGTEADAEMAALMADDAMGATDGDIVEPEPATEPDFAPEALDDEIAEEVAASAKSPAVESMSFGELEGSSDDDEDFGEPKEFALPSLEAFGERDEDVDIEEID